MNPMGNHDRPDWRTKRERIDLAAVATELLGQPPGRPGERGHRLWWRCPFHEDRNPSFVIDPGKPWWKCFGCGEHGDAATLHMRLEGLTFPEAVARLIGGGPSPSKAQRRLPGPPADPVSELRARPSGMPEAEALALVADSSARLWSQEGVEVLAYLTGSRCLSVETIQAARLGWTPGVRIPKKHGGSFEARGVVIPWFDHDRLVLVKIRQPERAHPKYAEAYRARPRFYPGPGAVRSARPLVVTEGEFDAMLVGQELAELASVVTLGSASGRPTPGILGSLLAAPDWYIGTDADEAGDKAAAEWPARSRRARPPNPYKDWTEVHKSGIALHRWWADRLDGMEFPPLYTWSELIRMPGLGPGIVIDQPDPTRRRLALRALARPARGNWLIEL